MAEHDQIDEDKVQVRAVYELGLKKGMDARVHGETSASACRRACPCAKDDRLRLAFIRGWKAGTGRTPVVDAVN